MYDKEAECVSAMAENGLLTNNTTEIHEASWVGALLGEDYDWDLATNVNAFAMQYHLLHVDSLFKIFFGSMTGRTTQPWQDIWPLFATNSSVIDLGVKS